MRGLGFYVDDDNVPSPENIPDSSDADVITNQTDESSTSTASLLEGQSWGWPGFCNQRLNMHSNNEPKIRGLDDILIYGISYLQMFLIFFPNILINLIVQQTNKNLRQQAKTETTYGEFLVFLGIQMYMSTLVGFQRREFWSMCPITLEEGAPFRLNAFMSCKRFEPIMENLCYTQVEAPTYKD